MAQISHSLYKGTIVDVVKKYQSDNKDAQKYYDKLDRIASLDKNKNHYNAPEFIVAAMARQGSIYDSLRTGLFNTREPALILFTPQQEALLKRLEESGYVDLGVDLPGAGRIRANVSRQRSGWKGSLRLVMHPMPTLESLGVPPELAKATTYHQVLVVIAGPNGHGKTTTLAAIVDVINSQKAHHVLTAEDPVGFVHPRKTALMSQREVGSHRCSFALALKASLREDPDVIVIGDLRDRETVEIAITAAETGNRPVRALLGSRGHFGPPAQGGKDETSRRPCVHCQLPTSLVIPRSRRCPALAGPIGVDLASAPGRKVRCIGDAGPQGPRTPPRPAPRAVPRQPRQVA